MDAHLGECPACRERVLNFQRARMGLLNESGPAGSSLPISSEFPELSGSDSLRDQNVNRATTSACPGESDLRDLAAGVCPEETAFSLTQHAAACDRCGALLRIYAEDFSADLSDDENALLNKTQSASPQWQRQTAREMMRAGGVETPAGAEGEAKLGGELRVDRVPRVERSGEKAALHEKSSWRGFPWKWVLIPATTAACALIAFGLWYQHRDTPEKVEKLLAQAYTEQRIIEMRIPLARHSEFHQLRSGDNRSLLSLPEASREAAHRIDDRLKKDPDSSEWLLLQARLDLLDLRYRPALSALSRITDDHALNSAHALMTRALATFQKAEAEHDQPSYFESLDLLGRVLQQSPDDPVALFNRALVCERTNMYECALRDWTRLLEIEKDPGWSGEARQHLAGVQEKKTPAR